MTVIKTEELLSQLMLDAQQILSQVSLLRSADDGLLNQAPAPGSWSIAQALEHLNFYSRSYLPKLGAKLDGAGSLQPGFKSGWLGNYFTKMMMPKADGVVVNKMSAPRDSRPAEQLNGKAVVEEFIRHQQALLQLLNLRKDLGVRVPTSISSLISLQAGDTFRFLLAHQQRHLAQAKRAAKAVGYDW